MNYDPALFAWSAPHYLRGRPPYSAELVDVLRRELGLDGTGVLLDVGCGPGVLAVQLAPMFETVIAVDPDRGMLDEAARHAAAHGVNGVHWLHTQAEAIPWFDLPPVRVTTFGQSFHWTDRELVAEAVFDALEPGGSIVLIYHDIEARPVPAVAPMPPVPPPIPDDDIRGIVRRYLGSDTRAGHGQRPVTFERFETSLARTRFGLPREVLVPGRTDIVRSVDEVVSNYLSMSFAAPHLFGSQLDAFVDDVRELLQQASPTGVFWDWPGDTAVLIATKP